MIDLSRLFATQGPWVFKTTCLFAILADRIESDMPEGTQVIVLEGTSMHDSNGFYNELLKKLKLPDYFGRNLNALGECITDLDWMDLTGQPFIILFRDADIMLNTGTELIDGFIDVMNIAGEEWAAAIKEGSEWDRPAMPFHVVFNSHKPGAFQVYDFPHFDI